MAILTHWETLDGHRRQLLSNLVENVQLNDYYLAGGTALSLQMGLRVSVDFDFFVPDKFNPVDLYQQITNICVGEPISILNITNGTCDLTIAGVQVSFFHYPQKMLQPYVVPDDAPMLKMASPEDIAIMKASAIGARGAKKDFFDLYFIMHDKNFTEKELIDGLYYKFGSNHDFSYIGMGLNYFEDAENDDLPHTFVNYSWKEIKSYFSSVQTSFMEALNEIQPRKTFEDKIVDAIDESKNTIPAKKNRENSRELEL